MFAERLTELLLLRGHRGPCQRQALLQLLSRRQRGEHTRLIVGVHHNPARRSAGRRSSGAC